MKKSFLVIKNWLLLTLLLTLVIVSIAYAANGNNERFSQDFITQEEILQWETEYQYLLTGYETAFNNQIISNEEDIKYIRDQLNTLKNTIDHAKDLMETKKDLQVKNQEYQNFILEYHKISRELVSVIKRNLIEFGIFRGVKFQYK